MRTCISALVVSTAARPYDRFGYILADVPSKLDIPSDDFVVIMDAVVDSEAYGNLAAIVCMHESEEIQMGELVRRGGEERRIRVQMAGLAAKVDALPQRVADAASTGTSSVASAVASAVVAAAAAGQQQSMCHVCKQPPFLANCRLACINPDAVGFPALLQPSCCPCRTALPSAESRCRAMADMLRRGNADAFRRAWQDWPEASLHAACVDEVGKTWLHLAAHFGAVDIMDMLLQTDRSTIELIDQQHGKPIACAIECQGLEVSVGFDDTVCVVRKLIEYGADTQSPCTPSTRAGLGRTPEYLMQTHYAMNERLGELLQLLKPSSHTGLSFTVHTPSPPPSMPPLLPALLPRDGLSLASSGSTHLHTTAAHLTLQTPSAASSLLPPASTSLAPPSTDAEFYKAKAGLLQSKLDDRKAETERARSQKPLQLKALIGSFAWSGATAAMWP